MAGVVVGVSYHPALGVGLGPGPRILYGRALAAALVGGWVKPEARISKEKRG